MKLIKRYVFVATFTCLSTALTIVLLSGCVPKRNPFLTTEISNSISIDGDWKKIDLPEPYKPQRKIQEVCVEFSEPVETEPYVWKPKLDNGVFATLQVQVIDADKNIFEFNEVSLLSDKQMCFELTAKDGGITMLPRDRTYRAIAIKSDYLMVLSRVYWLSYNPEDRK